MDYGKAIRIARAARSMSQKELAEAANLGKSLISLIESSRRTPSSASLEALARALDVPLYLLVLLGSDDEDLRGISSEQATHLGKQMLDLLQRQKSDKK